MSQRRAASRFRTRSQNNNKDDDSDDSSSGEDGDEDLQLKRNAAKRKESTSSNVSTETPVQQGKDTRLDTVSPESASTSPNSTGEEPESRSYAVTKKRKVGYNGLLGPRDYSVVRDYIVNTLFTRVKFVTTNDQLFLTGPITRNILTSLHIPKERWASVWEITRPQVKPIINQKRNNVNGEVKKAFLCKKICVYLLFLC